MMHWGWGDYGMGGYGFGWLFMILFWAFVILGIIYLVKMLAGGAGKLPPRETAEDILKKRFAKGELSREEFEEALKVLRQYE
jgi:putative membrane protein